MSREQGRPYEVGKGTSRSSRPLPRPSWPPPCNNRFKKRFIKKKKNRSPISRFETLARMTFAESAYYSRGTFETPNTPIPERAHLYCTRPTKRAHVRVGYIIAFVYVCYAHHPLGFRRQNPFPGRAERASRGVPGGYFRRAGTPRGNNAPSPYGAVVTVGVWRDEKSFSRKRNLAAGIVVRPAYKAHAGVQDARGSINPPPSGRFSHGVSRRIADGTAGDDDFVPRAFSNLDDTTREKLIPDTRVRAYRSPRADFILAVGATIKVWRLWGLFGERFLYFTLSKLQAKIIKETCSKSYHFSRT